ncbi:MAG: ABC transporter ATP-binding protein [Bacteriovoracaceae bacterium]|nr:ABC transporter ATP-binding protein [Bacteriovoracaceae bacterium]
MIALELKNIKKSFGETNILNGIDLKIEKGEFVVLVGPSGCGKSTLLRIISGLEKSSSGEIYINDKDQTKVEPQNRDIAMVFQSYALYPHMSVFENMAFSLKIQKLSEVEIKKRVEEVAELLKITTLLSRKPKELSGGQRQRVSLGRALVRRAPIILFDEPLSNLDAHLRNQMRIEIKKIHQHFKSTIVYVTHDQTEAMTMGDRIVVLNKGKIEQVDSPKTIYEKPKNTFVANFIGTPEINLLHGKIENGIFKSQCSSLDIKHTKFLTLTGEFSVGIRPEGFGLSKSPTSDDYKGTVIFLENLGPQTLVHAQVGENILRFYTENQELPKFQENIFFTIDQTKIMLFDKLGNLIE